MSHHDWKRAYAQSVELGAHRVLPLEFQSCRHPYSPAPGVFFACRKCDPCLARVHKDVVGRSIGECWGSEAAFFMTMTIGGDATYGSTANNPKAQSLCKADMQAFNKRLRKYICHDAHDGWLRRKVIVEKNGGFIPPFVLPSVRYFYVGEYGDRKGRPHYHQILFLQGVATLPDFPAELYDQDVFYGQMDASMDPYVRGKAMPHVDVGRTFWPYGYSFVRPFRRNDAFYVAKYVSPAVEKEAGGGTVEVMRPGRSLRPLLAAGYFDWLAGQHVDSQLPVRDDGYTLPRNAGYDGRLATYFMTRRTKLYFASSYVRQWNLRARIEPGFPTAAPRSEMIERFAENDAARVRRMFVESDHYKKVFADYVKRHRSENGFVDDVKGRATFAKGCRPFANVEQ